MKKYVKLSDSQKYKMQIIRFKKKYMNISSCMDYLLFIIIV